jgi:hypothetical protein
LPIPSELLGQLGVTAGQLLETSVSLDRLGNELQVLGADTLTVIGTLFVALKDVVGPEGGGARRTLAVKSLLAEMATDHRVNATDLLKDLNALLLDGG